MARTPSTMRLPVGTPLPRLARHDVVTGFTWDAAKEARGKKGLLVAFISTHCPFVLHIKGELVKVAQEALDQGFAVAMVDSNDPKQHDEDRPEAMARVAKAEGWRFPYLHDVTQEAAKAFHAACTPDLYLFDAQGKLAYRGQFDDARPSLPAPVTGSSLRAALKAVAAGQPVAGAQRASLGCNIKWFPGNEPA